MTNELRAIVGDYLFRNAESAYYILLDEFLDILVMDLMECLNLYPLGKVVGDHKHVHSLAWTVGNLSTMSIPHFMKGQGETMEESFSGGR